MSGVPWGRRRGLAAGAAAAVCIAAAGTVGITGPGTAGIAAAGAAAGIAATTGTAAAAAGADTAHSAAAAGIAAGIGYEIGEHDTVDAPGITGIACHKISPRDLKCCGSFCFHHMVCRRGSMGYTQSSGLGIVRCPDSRPCCMARSGRRMISSGTVTAPLTGGTG